MRDLLVQLGLAVTAAVLLKWFCVEAYRIPSPSMQPTLLGCDEADAHDHVLVDKAHYLFAAARRWDLAAFRAPLQQRDMFAKRIVGMPGERVAIAGGNLHVVRGEAGDRRFETLRRPPALQASQWREVHPARAEARGETPSLATSWQAEPREHWRDDEHGLRVALAPDRSAHLLWTDPDGGLVDRVWDGHPLPVARALRDVHATASHLAEIVPDARIALSIVPTAALTRCVVAIDVRRPDLPTLRFAWECEAGQARLVVRRDGAVVAASVAQPFAWPAATATHLEFAHVDDELAVWCDGTELARFDTGPFDCRAGCELPDPCGMGPAMPLPEQRADVRLELAGTGDVSLRQLRIWRDQHWTRGPLAPGAVVEVPADHVFVLGDNPLQSEDGRGWRSFAIGMLDGAAVPPSTPGARLLRGSLHRSPQDLPPARDENPLHLPALGRLVVRDAYGEIFTLRAEAAPAGEPDAPLLRWRGADGAVVDWALDAPAVQFVPQRDLVGRVALRCWPVPPFGPWRLGWLR